MIQPGMRQRVFRDRMTVPLRPVPPPRGRVSPASVALLFVA